MAVQKRFRAKALEAARRNAEGESYTEIGAALGVKRQTVSAWLRDPEVNAEWERHISDIIKSAYTSAMRRVAGQITSQNEWVAQGAARIAIDHYVGSNKKDNNVITIRFEDGQSMPDIGMPDAPEAE